LACTLTQKMVSAETLFSLAKLAKTPQLHTVYFDGFFALQSDISSRIRLIIRFGCLLHVGQVSA
jgi:hypothetical protein